MYNVEGCQKVQTWNRTVSCSHHCERFSRPSLAISEASCFCTLESFNDKWKHTILIDLLIIFVTVEHIVKCKMMLFYELSEVYLGSVSKNV